MSEDRDQIIELMANYGWAIDSRDWVLLRRCFLSDAVVRYASFGGELVGHAELESYMRAAVARLDATQHLFANFVVRTDGEQGQYRCLVQAQHVRDRGLFTVGGSYQVDVARTVDGWRIARLEFVPSWTSGDPQVVEHVLEHDARTSP